MFKKKQIYQVTLKGNKSPSLRGEMHVLDKNNSTILIREQLDSGYRSTTVISFERIKKVELEKDSDNGALRILDKRDNAKNKRSWLPGMFLNSRQRLSSEEVQHDSGKTEWGCC